MPLKLLVPVVVTCLLLTVESPVRADDSRWGYTGATARAGTSVGFSELAGHRWSTLGGHIAAGYRFGALAIETEYEESSLLYHTGHDNLLRGNLGRLGTQARLYFARLHPFSESTSHFLLFADVTLGRQRGRLEGEAFARSDYGVGAGWLLDHEVQRPGTVRRVAWHFGWRFTGAERAAQAMARVVCGKKCPSPMTSPQPRPVDLSLAVSSSLVLSW